MAFQLLIAIQTMLFNLKAHDPLTSEIDFGKANEVDKQDNVMYV
jgi:hypothetical protein